MTNTQKYNDLGSESLDLIDKYKDSVPPYEIAGILIHHAVSLLLYSAPSERLAWKTILACVESGVAIHEETYENEEKTE